MGGYEEASDGSWRLVSPLGSRGRAQVVDKAARAASSDWWRAEPVQEGLEGLVGWDSVYDDHHDDPMDDEHHNEAPGAKETLQVSMHCSLRPWPCT